MLDTFKCPAFFCVRLLIWFLFTFVLRQVLENILHYPKLFSFWLQKYKKYCIFAKGTENYPIYEENNASRNALGRIHVDAG